MKFQIRTCWNHSSFLPEQQAIRRKQASRVLSEGITSDYTINSFYRKTGPAASVSVFLYLEKIFFHPFRLTGSNRRFSSFTIRSLSASSTMTS